jgi:hypothetical protein
MPKATRKTSAFEDTKLDARALREYMTVLDDGDERARDAPGLYTVTTESGSQYLVDTGLPACECEDFQYRDRHCKHIRRVMFATGRREPPEWATERHIDPQLGEHVESV